MNTRSFETDRLLEIEDSNKKIVPEKKSEIESIPEDIFNLISYYLNYTNELFALRQTSKQMKNAVDMTPAGKFANHANNIKPNWIISSLVSSIGQCLLLGTSASFGITTIMMGVATALGRSCLTTYNCFPDDPTCHNPNPVTECSGVDLATGIPLTASLLGLTTTSILLGGYGLFKKSQIHDRLKEIDSIREKLKQPITPCTESIVIQLRK
jgi:hypothetical protein